jgi:ketosteroid isomerase-like protein
MTRSILAAAALLTALAAPLRAQGDAGTTEAIRTLEARWIQAMAGRDVSTLESLLAPDFIATDGGGRRLSRAGYLAIFRGDAPLRINLAPDQDTVITRSGVAVHLGSGIETVTRREGSVNRFHQVWTDTWVREPDGSWRCLASQWIELPAT